MYQWDLKRFLIFKILISDYKNGNLCDMEYLLEESYIKEFINNAKIINGKTPIVGNKSYFTDGDKY